MKKIILSLMAIVAIHYAKAQNTPWSTTESIGIGTTTPVAGLSVETALSAAIAPLTVAPNSSAWIGSYASSGGISIGQFSGNYGYLQSRSKLTTLPAINLVLNPIGGNVGIATVSPISTFQVGATYLKASIGSASGQNLNYGTSYLGFNGARDGSTNWTIESDGIHNGGGIIYGDVYGDINFAPVASTGAYTQTLTDQAIKNMICFSITAAGVTRVKQIVVSLTNWPDYVFKSTYHLPSLSEVKTYVDLNHHLPEIPSEQEIVTNGLNLGDMDRVLTKKVEELTLYLIEKDKQLNEQKDIVGKQQARIDSQESQLKAQQQQMDLLKQQLVLILKKQGN